MRFALVKQSIMHAILVHLLGQDAPCNALFQRGLYLFQKPRDLLDFQNMAVLIHVCINRFKGYINSLALIPVYHSMMWAFIVRSCHDSNGRTILIAMFFLILAHILDHDASARSFFFQWSVLDRVLGYTQLIVSIGPWLGSSSNMTRHFIFVSIGLYTWGYILLNPTSFFDKDREPVYTRPSAEFYVASTLADIVSSPRFSGTAPAQDDAPIMPLLFHVCFASYCLIVDRCRQLVSLMIMDIPALLRIPKMYLFSQYLAPTVLFIRALHFEYIHLPPKNGIEWFAYTLFLLWNVINDAMQSLEMTSWSQMCFS